MIWISDEWKDYEVLDASDGERLERWGNHILGQLQRDFRLATCRCARIWQPSAEQASPRLDMSERL